MEWNRCNSKQLNYNYELYHANNPASPYFQNHCAGSQNILMSRFVKFSCRWRSGADNVLFNLGFIKKKLRSSVNFQMVYNFPISWANIAHDCSWGQLAGIFFSQGVFSKDKFSQNQKNLKQLNSTVLPFYRRKYVEINL